MDYEVECYTGHNWGPWNNPTEYGKIIDIRSIKTFQTILLLVQFEFLSSLEATLLVGNCLSGFDYVLWHINHCRLFNAKSYLYIYIKYIWFGLVGFYGISTIVGY